MNTINTKEEIVENRIRPLTTARKLLEHMRNGHITDTELTYDQVLALAEDPALTQVGTVTIDHNSFTYSAEMGESRVEIFVRNDLMSLFLYHVRYGSMDVLGFTLDEEKIFITIDQDARDFVQQNPECLRFVAEHVNPAFNGCFIQFAIGIATRNLLLNAMSTLSK